MADSKHNLRSVVGLTLLGIATVGTVPVSLATTPVFQKQQAALPPVTALPLSSINEAYTLGAGDQIQLDIFDAPEFSGQNGRFQVLVDGTLNLPLVGSLSVKGLTLKQASNLLSEKFLRFFKRPLTTVTLLAPRPVSVSIAGEINRPGSYTVSLAQQNISSGTQFPTLTSALKLAGGITQAADVRNIQIRRPQRVGGNQTVTVDLWQFLQTGDRQQDLALRDGDSILIPTATNVNLAESAQLADATFAADQGQPITIAVVGEVFRPGSYTVTSDARTGTAGIPGVSTQTTVTQGVNQTTNPLPTVTRALQVAGGIKPMADIRRIQIRRLTRSGEERSIDVNLQRLIKDGDLRQDTILQTGDTVVIPTATNLTPAEASEIASASFSPDTIRINVVGEVKQPGVVQVPPNTPLNQALLAAGGFDPRRARKKSVDLIRLNPDGTVTKREVSIDLARGINDQTNPALRNNDIIVVGRSGLTSFTDGLGTVLSPFNSIFSILNIFGL
ncbi:MAG: SLBB domain-containing protein [Tildeniella nuda ZEHNDER 1965/U140]|jgi:polysaccharide export outer membrane protein|nr:SLBB domain-containing protein [Tildeniella nuda ZEHNDER 1965/U140]